MCQPINPLTTLYQYKLLHSIIKMPWKVDGLVRWWVNWFTSWQVFVLKWVDGLTCWRFDKFMGWQLEGLISWRVGNWRFDNWRVDELKGWQLKGWHPGAQLTHFNDRRGGGGLSDCFEVWNFGQKWFFWVYKRCRDFFGSQKNKWIFWGVVKKGLRDFLGYAKKVVIFLGRQSLKLW